jgi:hypothetical protein
MIAVTFLRQRNQSGSLWNEGPIEMVVRLIHGEDRCEVQEGQQCKTYSDRRTH